MAFEGTQLAVAIEARIRDFERNMQRASKIADDNYKAIEKRGKQAAKNINDAFASNDNGKALAKSTELTSQQFAILNAAARDAFASLASGQSVMTVLAQQGSNVTAAIGEEGVLGLLGGIGSGLKGLVTPATAAMAAIVAVGAGGAYALSRYREEQLAIELGLTGIGRLSGATAADIRAVGEEAAKTGTISAAAAREVALALASTGKVRGSDIAGVTALAPGFAKLFNVSTKEAGARLAGIFSDPVKGAEELDGRLGLLDDRTRQYIRTLTEQGNRQQAIRTLIAAVTPELQAVAEQTSTWARAWNAVANAADTAATSVGKALSGASPKEQLAALKARRDAAGGSSEPDLVAALRKAGLTDAQITAQVPSYNPASAKAIEAEIAAIEERIRKEEELRKAKEETLRVADASKAAGDLIRQFNEEAEAVDALSNQYESLRTKLNDPAVVDKLDGGAEKAQATLATLEKRIEAVTADYKAGGTAAAAALRNADYLKATSGLDAYRKGLAEINRQYDEQIRLAKASGDAATTAARVAALEAERGARIGSYQTENQARARASVGLSGGFVDSVIGAESSGDDFARNSRSSATGAGQFIDSTWLTLFRRVYSEMAAELSDGAILALRTNREYSRRLIEEYARENALKLQQAGFDASDRNLHLAHFLGSGGAVSMLRANPSANAASILPDAARANPEVFKRGAASVQDLLDYAEKRAQRGGSSGRAQIAAVTGLRAEAEAYGKTAAEAEKLKSVQEQLDADREKGGELSRRFATAQDLIKASSEQLTPELRAQREEVLKLADARASAAANGLNSRFEKDLAEARAALARTAGEQADRDRVKGYGVDPASSQGQAMQAQLATLREMQNLKQAAGGFADSFVGDMIKGADAVTALNDALKRTAERLLRMVAEELFAKAFAGLIGAAFGSNSGSSNGGGFGAIFQALGSVLGFASGGYTGDGGRYEPAGVVHRGEFVMSKPAVARIGAGNLDALHRGALKGFADGGLVGGVPPLPSVAPAAGAAMGGAPVISPTINVSVTQPAGSDARSGDEFGARIAKQIDGQLRNMVHQEILRSMRPGGAIKDMYG